MDIKYFKNIKIKVFLKFLIGVFIIALILYKVGFTKTINILSEANLLILFSAFVTFTLVLLIMSFRWKNFLNTVSNQPISIMFSLKMIFIGLFFAEFTPGRVGDASRVYIAKLRGHIPFSKGLPLFIVERLFDIGIITILALTSFFFMSKSELLTDESIYSILLPAFLTVIVIFSVFFVVILKPHIFHDLLEFFVKNIFKRINAFRKIDIDTSSISQNFSGSLNELGKNKRVILINILLSIGIWLLHVFRIYLVAMSLGADVGLKYFLFIVPVMYMLAIIPITVGGLGIMEMGAAALYTMVDVPIEISIAIPLVDRILTAPFYVVVGYMLSIHEFKDIFKYKHNKESM